MKWHLLCLALLLLSHPRVTAQDIEETPEEDEPVEEDKAFLLAKKSLASPKEFIVGKNATIRVEIYNAGNSAAYDVEVVDADWDSRFFTVVDGSLEATFERVSAGSVVSYEYVIKPLGVASGRASPAQLKYKPFSEATELQVAFSTVMTVGVLTEWQTRLRQLLVLGSYATFGNVKTFAEWKRAGITLGALTLLAALVYGLIKFDEAKTTKRREKAIKEIDTVAVVKKSKRREKALAAKALALSEGEKTS